MPNDGFYGAESKAPGRVGCRVFSSWQTRGSGFTLEGNLLSNMKTTRTYALGFLKARSEEGDSAGAFEVEYRLSCSGELYNRNIKTGDWRKSDATRILLRTPFELFVASDPFDDYPQELCARLVVNRVVIENPPKSFTRVFLPDEDASLSRHSLEQKRVLQVLDR